MTDAASGLPDDPPPAGGTPEPDVPTSEIGIPERGAVLASDVSEARSPQRRLLAAFAAATRSAALSAARATGRGCVPPAVACGSPAVVCGRPGAGWAVAPASWPPT